MSEIEEHDGIITMFARAPGQVATQPPSSGAVVRRGATRGNPNFDPVTGKFAGKKLRDPRDGEQGPGRTTQQTGAPRPGNLDPVALQRRRDLVRRAAAAMEEFTMTTAGQWLEAFGVDVASANVEQFLGDVRNQRVDYLVDAMRPNLRATVDAQHQNQVVTLKAPAAWTSSTLNSLTDGEMLQLYQRLAGQGFDPEDVSKNLIKRIRNKKRKTALEQLFGEAAPVQGQPAQ
jgi:hypothetical protein